MEISGGTFYQIQTDVEHVLHKSKLLWFLNSWNATWDLQVAGYQ